MRLSLSAWTLTGGLAWLLGVASPADSPGRLSGRVFEDANTNGVFDAGEPGLAGVRVSDGQSVVATDAEGRYEIPARSNPPPRFVFVSKPAGHRCINGFYRRLTNGCPTSADFALAPDPEAQATFAFLQIGDSETAETKALFIEEIQAALARRPIRFVLHTGDFCHRRGIKAHSEWLPRQGPPVYHVAGNHDYIATKEPYKSWEDYDPTLERSEEYFERFLGPTHYSFEYGNALFIALSGRGDGAPSPEMPDIQLAWLQNELARVPADKPLIVFQHIPPAPLTLDLVVRNTRGDELNLSDRALKALITGHWHNHAAVTSRTGLAVTTVPPNKGGIDYSPRGLRFFTWDGDRVRVETRLGGLTRKATLVSPPETCVPEPDGRLAIYVNAYDSRDPVREARFRWGDGPWAALQPAGDWSWTAKTARPSADSKTAPLRVEVRFGDQAVTLDRTVRFQTPPGSASSDVRTNGPVPPLRLAWISRAGKSIGFSAPVADVGRVFIGTLDDDQAEEQAVVALDIETGRRLWTFKPAASIKHTLAAAGGLVFAQCYEGILYALDAGTGALRWSNREGRTCACCGHYGAVFQDRGRLLLQADRGLLCLETATGKELWSNPAVRLLKYGRDAIFNVLAHDGVYHLACNRAIGLAAVEADTGRLLWTTNQVVSTGPAALGSRLYVAAHETLQMLDVATGTVITNRSAPDFQTAAQPLIYGNTIVLGTSTNGLCAFDTETLDLKWRVLTGPALVASGAYLRDGYRAVHSTPVRAGALLYFGGMDGWLYAVDADTGSVAWKFDLGVPLFGAPAVAGNKVLIAGFDGNVYAFEGAAGEGG